MVALLCASCSAASSDGDVEMTAAQEFSPATITVSVGETITFVNGSDEAHTVTAYEAAIPNDGRYFASGDFDSEEAALADLSAGLIDPGATYEVTLEEAGTYEYFCIPHEGQGMTGSIVVGKDR